MYFTVRLYYYDNEKEDGTFLTIDDFRNAMYLTTVILLVTNDRQSMLVLMLMLTSWTDSM
ncbi:hypothetical protein T4D_15870 [Trichinella pseudospiralis]|uniref:Uncharacterized protein n=1 Tax=Trichinella pseudospiralis TaxID=6337 RepID=A0A0V1FJL7_TRIPS|nr:hypothetical protein T4D_15870 [Trichinella pseudospiralis]